MLSEELKGFTVYLASKSPRRKQLLDGLDLKYKFIDIDVEEVWPEGTELLQIPEYLARLKSQAAAASIKDNEIVITADTAVFLEGEILGKPNSKDEAIQMLQKLSANVHKVITGVCLASNQKIVSFSDLTEVHFNELKAAEINYYVDHYQPYDKAGSYGAQDWIGYIGIERLIGSYYNVMGLPVRKLYRELINFVKN